MYDCTCNIYYYYIIIVITILLLLLWAYFLSCDIKKICSITTVQNNKVKENAEKFVCLFIVSCLKCLVYKVTQVRHFEESLDLKMIWIDVLPNGSTLSFQNQWPCKWCIRCTLCDECILYNTVTYLAASSRLLLMQTRLSPQMADRAMGELHL